MHALILLLFAAPIPQARPCDLRAGQWVLHFSGTWQMTLSHDGNYTASNGRTAYHGSWSFNPKSRILVIHESNDNTRWLTWMITLRDGLAGATEHGNPVRIERRR